jgi:hypothetical protein
LLRKDGAPGHEAVLAVFILGKERAEAIELSLPCGAVVADPLLQEAEACGLDAAGSYAAQLFCVHEANLFEDLQVLRYGGKRDAEGSRKSRYGHGAAGEMVEDRTARGITESVKQEIDFGIRLRHGWPQFSGDGA